MDLQQIEHAVDLRMAQAMADAKRSPAIANFKKLVRGLTFRAAILLLLLGLSVAVSPLVMERLLLEDKMAKRLTPAAIGSLILGFSATILTMTYLMKKFFQGSFRRALILSCISVSMALLAGSIWLHGSLVAHHAAGSHHLIWLCPLMIVLGLPAGWSWSYHYRKVSLRQKRMLRAADADWRTLRKSMIQTEIKNQQFNAKMTKWDADQAKRDADDAKWKTGNAEREQLKYRVQYMKG